MGLPGAGKTTTATLMAQHTNATHLSSDEIRLQLFPEPTLSQAEHDKLYDSLNARTYQLLLAGKSVIYDANLNRFMHRQEKYDLARKAGAKTVLIWVQTAKDVAKERRMQSINQQLIPAGEDPGDMFERVARIIEPPEETEEYIAIQGENVTQKDIAAQFEASHEQATR